jgi:23S rRNA pseudouridine2605 synthase/23S rRNA pseudouridine2604 synthase
MRLQKYLSQAGICSRRKAEEYIAQGLILINGTPATIGQSIDETVDVVTYDGKMVAAQEQQVYYKFNKPYGIVTTCKLDGQSSIMDIINVKERIFPIGRLDKNTTGLILMTNDGRLSNYLIHPRYEHEKEYVVEVYGKIDDAALEAMAQ